jgi:putative N6-adenine-specific DNA methylase
LKIQIGRIDFQAGLEAIARCNLWLRSADRLLLKIGEFTALSFDVVV